MGSTELINIEHENGLTELEMQAFKQSLISDGAGKVFIDGKQV